jgi:toxin ParE1/3/4
VILHPHATHELQEAADYYERQQVGLGDRFLDAVESGFTQIRRSPFTWRRIRGDIRRFLVRTFPFGMVYIYKADQVFVLAVMHLKREPNYWLGRLESLHFSRPPDS